MRPVVRKRISLISFLFIIFFVLSLLYPSLSSADELGEFILNAILKGEKPTDSALLLLTQDLKWYEANMGRLPQSFQNRVQQIRINIAGDSSRMAAQALNEAEAAFVATGSWRPGRDMDILYLGTNSDQAVDTISASYETVTGGILAQTDNDPILRQFGGEIPKKLTTESLAVCTTELPNYGYSDLQKAYKKAREALARGEAKEEILELFRKEIEQAMSNNVKAHFAAASNPDYYAGATGQEWFRRTYLENPEKMRIFVQDADGNWVLRQAVVSALPDEIVARLGFGGLAHTGQGKFPKIASDYSLFFSHMHSGPSDNAKYVMRVWQDIGLNAIQDLTDDELKLLAASKAISNNPSRANQILAQMGIGSIDEFNESLSRILYRWTESQLIRDMNRLVSELSASSAKTVDELDALLRQAKVNFDLQELVAGLNKLQTAPKEIRLALIETLKKRFGTTESGKAAINFIMRQLQLLGDDTGEITRRIIRMLQNMRQITDDEARSALASLDAGKEIEGPVAAKVKRARREVMILSAGSMTEFDDTVNMEDLMEDWRKSQPDALIQSPNSHLKNMIQEMRSAPDIQLQSLGWTAEELRIQNRIRELLQQKKGMMKQLGEKLAKKLLKVKISLREFQMKLREIMFNPAHIQLGDPSMSIGAFDAVVGVAVGLYQTYDIFFNRNLSLENENLELGNAWVTAIPIVGDFAQGIITGNQAFWEGDKGKALEAGLWVTIGIMGCVPGGQLPAVIAGIALATKPLAMGAYDARQAQNLVQAWVESGDWSVGEKPRRLRGLFDREDNLHALTYEDLLTEKGNKPYKSARAEGLTGKIVAAAGTSGVTINDSIRAYAEQYVMPSYPAIDNLRRALKSVYPDFADKDWDNESIAKIKVDVRGGKGSLVLFRAYYLLRTKALEQTIAQLKAWAEDEMRAAKDYDPEIARLKEDLRKLQDELRCQTLIPHADESVESYTRIIKNIWEQESLPLSRLRIYEHYVKEYTKIAGKIRRLHDLFLEIDGQYFPASWHLTGFPEFDSDRINTLLSSMENGRKSIIEYIEKLLREFNFAVTKYDPSHECHKKTFDTLAPFRYNVAFIENMVVYYKHLADSYSAWGNAYETAKKRYSEQRDSMMEHNLAHTRVVIESKAFQDAFMTFVSSLPYELASKEVELYRNAYRDFEVRLHIARKDYEMATWKTGEGGRVLQDCLLANLKVSLELSEMYPLEGQNITAIVRLTGGTPPKETYWHWKTSGGLVPSSQAGQEITLKVISEGIVTVQLLDHFDPKLAIVLTTASVPVKTKKKDDKKPDDTKAGDIKSEDMKPYGFSFSTSWEVIPVKNGFDLKRKEATKTSACGDKTCSAFVRAALQLRWCESFCPENMDDLKKAVNSMHAAKIRGTYHGVTPGKEEEFTIGDFKGFIAHKPPQLYYTGTPEAVDLSFPSTISWVTGYLLKGKSVISINGDVYGGGERKGEGGKFWFDDTPFVDQHTKAAYEEMMAVLKSIAIVPDNKINKIPYKGPAFDGSDLPKVKLVYSEKGKLKMGDVVPVKAVVENAKPEDSPLQFEWSGNHEGKGETVNFMAQKAGTNTLTVTVNGARFSIGSASVNFEVEDLKAVIIKDEPSANSFPIGKKARFSVTLTSGGQKVSGKYIYRWQPSTEVTFTPLEGTSAQTTGIFKRTGRTQVWVEVLIKKGDVLSTVARSENLELDIIYPTLTLSAVPDTPMIGQEVKITVQEDPKMDDKAIDFWWEIAGNATNPGPLQNNRIYTYKPKDTKPVTVTVHGKGTDKGDDLGSQKITITAKAYAISISSPKYLGSKPRIWKCDTEFGRECPGLVEVGDTQFAVHHDIFMKAGINPSADRSKLRYGWTISPGGCSGGGSISDEIRLNCSTSGVYTVKVEVTNTDGAKLGEATQSATISISEDTLNNSKKAKEAYDKLQKSKELVARGKLDEGIALAEEASKLDPKNTEAANLSAKWKKEKETLLQHIGRMKKFAEEGKIPEAKNEFSSAKNLHPKYQAVIDAENFLKAKIDEANERIAKAKKLRDEGETFQNQKQYEEALNKYRASLKLWPDPKLEEHIKLIEATLDETKKKKQTADRLWNEGIGLYNQKKYTDALGKLKESLAHWSDQSRQDYVQKMETAKASAKKLRDEGESFQNQGKLQDAVNKYKQSVKTWPNPSLEEHIAKVEDEISRIEEKKACAKKNRDEGAALQQQNRLSEALEKFNASYACWPTPEMDKHIKDIKNYLNRQQAQAGAHPSDAGSVSSQPTSNGTTGPSATSGFSLGRIWRVKQWIGKESWTWVWTRQGDSNTFDALARHDQNSLESRHAIYFESEKNGQVTFSRPDAYGKYIGKLSPDRKRVVSGTMDSINHSDQGWTAEIEGQDTTAGTGQVSSPQTTSSASSTGEAGISLGRVWHVIEVENRPNGLKADGTWTRRGSTNTFDAVWVVSTRRERVYDTITIESVSGDKIILFRHGNNGRYTGSLSSDRKSIVSGSMSWANSWSWTATIDGQAASSRE